LAAGEFARREAGRKGAAFDDLEARLLIKVLFALNEPRGQRLMDEC
jgi:hypothetical protein